MTDEDEMNTEITHLSDHQESNETTDAQGTDPVKRVRPPRMRDPGTRLRKLECFPEIHERVKAGEPLRDVARYIRAQEQELEDLSEEALVYMLRKYRDYIFSENTVHDTTPSTGGVPDDPLHELYVLQRKFNLLDERIDQEAAIERQLNKLFSTTHKEFAELRALGGEILKHKKDLKIISKDRRPGRQQVGSGLPGKLDIIEEVAKPASRQRILNFVDTVMADPDMMDALAEETEEVRQDRKERLAKQEAAEAKKEAKKKASKKKTSKKKKAPAKKKPAKKDDVK